MDEQQYRTLIIRFLNNDLSEQERNRLNRWIEESSENRRVFEEYRSLWSKTRPPQPEGDFPLEKGWQEIAAKIETGPVVADNIIPFEKRANPRWPVSLRSGYAAAAVLLVILGGSLSYYFLSVIGQAGQVFTTTKGQQATYTLPDQTIVRLNADSQLKLLDNFSGDSRQVYLQGEAFFEVSHRQSLFAVVTDNARVTVLGTQFNINARQRETAVFVRQGKVSFKNRQQPDSTAVLLTRNLFSRCIGDKAATSARAADSTYYLGWLDNKIIFHKTPLSEIAKTLERAFDVEIEIVGEGLKAQTVNGTFDESDVESIVSDITLALGLTYTVHDGIIRISDN